MKNELLFFICIYSLFLFTVFISVLLPCEMSFLVFYFFLFSLSRLL